MAATHHGLTVYTVRNDEDAQRLQRPVVGDIRDCFNSATSDLTCQRIYGDFGHSGIDCESDRFDAAFVINSGEVNAFKNDWATTGGGSKGNYITIHTGTQADPDSGSEH